MSINRGSGLGELAQGWYGSNPLKEIWVGSNKVWPTGPDADAAFRLKFDSAETFLNNTGTASDTNPVMESAGTITFDKDHAIFGTNGRLFAQPNSSWLNGWTLSMWTRDTPANSGWRTIMHRAMPSGTLTNEAYIVHNTSATTTTTVSGLKFGSTHREFTANYSLPVGADWFHTVVVWERTSATTFQCRFYINGVSRGIYDGTGYLSTDQFTTESLYIGGNRTAGEWSGRMDDLIMWRRALSTAEVAELYAMGRSAAPQITTLELNPMKMGTAFSQQLQANFTPSGWSAVGVPPGLTLTTGGFLSGTPTQVTSGTMTVTATESGTGYQDQRSYSWTVASNLVSISVPFNSNADIDNNFPIRGFDARTSSSSPRNPAFTFSGMLVAGDNNVATYWQALHGTEIKSESVQWSMNMGDVMNTIDRPTEIILSSDANLQNQLLLRIGSGNIYLAYRTTGSTTNLKTLSRTIGTRSNITVNRSGLTITVYHDSTNVLSYTGTTSNAASWFRTAGRAYSGITMYSTSGQWSPRVDSFSVKEY